jgi:hypothetical protein
MIINENGWGNKPQETKAKESILAKKVKKQAEPAPAEADGDTNAEQE